MPFAAFGLHPDIVAGVRDLAFTRPTPIQADAIPPALKGHDILGCAATGSGKTAAFMLPTMHHLMTHRPVGGAGRRRVRALVLTPTRELAAQIHQNLVEMATHTPLSGAIIIGGVAMGPQEHAFRTGVDILIATPGRLLDHLRNSYADLSAIEVLVLDEADRMLDMGFLPDIRRILKVLPVKRQTLFFSATMPAEIRSLANDLLKNPVVIQMERKAAPAAGITQAIYPVGQHLKQHLLVELLKNQQLESVICFTRTKHRANRVADFLERQGVASARIHGNRSQAQRTAALAGFKAGKFRVLVATDIAARGIDISEVSHVINFDCPHIAEDYIHRVGRTGRAAATGDAFTFVSPDEESNVRIIERAIGNRLPRVTLPNFNYNQQPAEKLEIPLAQRIAAIRQRKAQERENQGRRQMHDRGRGGQAGHQGHKDRTWHEPKHAAHAGQRPREHQGAADGVGRSGGGGARHGRPKPQGGFKHQGRPGGGPNRPSGYGRFGESRGNR